MKILFVSVEAAPFAKVGGLADVVGSLPLELRRLGHDARVVMPLYRMIEEDPRWALETSLESFEVKLNAKWSKTAIFRETEHRGMPVGFVGTDQWFTEADRSENLYGLGVERYLFFTEAVLRAMETLDWIPDVIHCHDWHTGLLPAMLRHRHPRFEGSAAVFSIHNLAYQGEFGPEVLDALDLPRSLYNSEGAEAWGRLNFLKAGMAFADLTNTVSPNYAQEIQTPQYGCALDGFTRHLAGQDRLRGILNGLDLDRFNPETDPDLPERFSADNLGGKAVCRARLVEELGWSPMDEAPIVGVVSRLSNQKGMDLMLEAAEAYLEFPMRLAVLGVGDPFLAAGFRDLERRYPDRVRLIERFDVSLAQRIYAGSDAFLMPSSFEPCGLGQLIAMRYGTLPVVRATGGLSDTVQEGVNGFVFEERSALAMTGALARMHRAFRQGDTWSRMQQTGMRGEYGWTRSAQAYEAMYRDALAIRRARPAAVSRG